jgi:prepilin-type N-terminal cleavage/methylation domain-containing protein/prepilin-type processing-associated H-X9-DG protein
MRIVKQAGNKASRSAFTLVELLVVIAIIGVLVALLLPAIQAARESSRRATCKNHLRQISTAWLNHESSVGHLPTGGWTIRWVGDADRGFGEDQPGGWIYNILPFIEDQALHDMPADSDIWELTVKQIFSAQEMIEQSRSWWNCPSRRFGVFPEVDPPTIINAEDEDPPALASFHPRLLTYTGNFVGKTDYAANGGTSRGWDTRSRASEWPGSIHAVKEWEEGLVDRTGVYWRLQNNLGNLGANGVTFQRSEVRMQNIEDGTSNTYMVGEKNLTPGFYENGLGEGDEANWAVGSNTNTIRSAQNIEGVGDCAQDLPFVESIEFGSAHAGAWHMAFVDGHVEALRYDIDGVVYTSGADRADGNASASN